MLIQRWDDVAYKLVKFTSEGGIYPSKPIEDCTEAQLEWLVDTIEEWLYEGDELKFSKKEFTSNDSNIYTTSHFNLIMDVDVELVHEAIILIESHNSYSPASLWGNISGS